MLCVGQVLGEPILTTAATCGTAVGSSLSSARLPQWSQTQAYALQTFITLLSKAYSSRQMQGVVVTALNRRHGLQVQCTASASCSSTEAASSVLSTSSESWIACVGRANSSTQQGSRSNIWHKNKPNCEFGENPENQVTEPNVISLFHQYQKLGPKLSCQTSQHNEMS